MNAEALRARLTAPVDLPEPAHTTPARTTIEIRNPPAIGAPIGSPDAANLADAPLIPAAVLVAFLLGPTPGVLLTKRTAHLAKHPGQVSFPGGRIDPEDATPEAAALREAAEEIDLDPTHVELIGRLGDFVTGTGYRITPVLGLLPEGKTLADLALHASPHEVDEIFALPLSVLLDPAAPERRGSDLRGRWREFWVWPHPDHYIWGATAAILVDLAARLRRA